MTETSLQHATPDGAQGVALRLRLWAEAPTAPSTKRRDDLQGYKQRIASSFFSFVGKPPGEVSVLDVDVAKINVLQLYRFNLMTHYRS